MIALSRLDLEENQVAPLHVLLGRPLDGRRPYIFSLAVRDRIQLESTTPFGLPSLQERFISRGNESWIVEVSGAVGQIQDV